MKRDVPGKSGERLVLDSNVDMWPNLCMILFMMSIKGVVNMKAIQITFDEALLERLDRHPSVRERGRSAVVREAAAEYLKRRDAEDIARQYRAGYWRYLQPR